MADRGKRYTLGEIVAGVVIGVPFGLAALYLVGDGLKATPQHADWRVSTVACDPTKVAEALSQLSPGQAREARVIYRYAAVHTTPLNECAAVDIFWEMGR